MVWALALWVGGVGEGVDGFIVLELFDVSARGDKGFFLLDLFWRGVLIEGMAWDPSDLNTARPLAFATSDPEADPEPEVQDPSRWCPLGLSRRWDCLETGQASIAWC